MSKQSRLNKQKAEKAKAKGNQDGKHTQGHQHDAQRNSQERGEGVMRKDDKRG